MKKSLTDGGTPTKEEIIQINTKYYISIIGKIKERIDVALQNGIILAQPNINYE